MKAPSQRQPGYSTRTTHLERMSKSLGNIAKVVGRSVNCIQKVLQKFDPKISAPKIAASTSNTLGRSVSVETVRRVLRKAGYNGRVARKKPLIGKRNRVKRLKFAKEHILKPQQFWNEVTFSAMRSSDLNVIENLWSHLERAVQKHQITSKEQLKSVLQEKLLNIAPETTRHLVESMSRQLEAVISAKGYATKY
ncbi:HTH_Tnp_Tc3_2 domain-containing protein [Trichonephila clavipes]|nr:HTH_Tnp_Tc3_2 domain-containing protein [Trichonephila clavipes]